MQAQGIWQLFNVLPKGSITWKQLRTMLSIKQEAGTSNLTFERLREVISPQSCWTSQYLDHYLFNMQQMLVGTSECTDCKTPPLGVVNSS